MMKKDCLLGRLRKIGSDVGDLETRFQAAHSAIQDERPRFTRSEAGQIQWNWLMGQLAVDLALERNRLADALHKKPRPGEAPPGPIIELFDRLGPCILELKEAKREPIAIPVSELRREQRRRL